MITPQFYAPYWQWEDHDAGMYAIPGDAQAEVARSRVLLANPGELLDAMLKVTYVWPTATRLHFTNPCENRRAWLGQAACKLGVDSTAIATRSAWWHLADREQQAANRSADEAIHDWEDRNDAETLFRL